MLTNALITLFSTHHATKHLTTRLVFQAVILLTLSEYTAQLLFIIYSLY